jgi:hypothetical protein
VLGANDGIVSVAALVVVVAGATTATAPILTAGAAGVVGGAFSMALGEYVSVLRLEASVDCAACGEYRRHAEPPFRGSRGDRRLVVAEVADMMTGC